MDNTIQVERVSALAGHYQVGKHGLLGADNSVGVTMQDRPNLVLSQIAGWSDTIDEVSSKVAESVGVKSAPGPCRAESGKVSSALRIEPMKWWIFGDAAPELDSAAGCTLDISHSRTHIRINGSRATEFLNRLLPLDLREQSFPVGAVASSVIHHVGITLWRSDDGYEMFIPRGFALVLWEGFVEIAEQFGLEIL